MSMLDDKGIEYRTQGRPKTELIKLLGG